MASKNVLPRLVKQIASPTMTSRRVVSTSLRTDQSVTSLDMPPMTMGCPFQKSIDTITDAIAARKEPPQPVVDVTSGVKPFSELPGPKGLPIVGTLFEYFKKDGPKFSQMFEVFKQRSEQYGPVYFEKVGGFSSVVISDPATYSSVRHNESRFPNRREMMPVSYYRLKKGLDQGVVNSQGEEWYKQRTVVSKQMLKLNNINRVCAEMGGVADDFMLRLSAVRNAQGEVPKLERELFKWALESVGTFLFEERIGCLGSQPPPLAQSFIENLEGFFKYLQPLMYNLPIYQLIPTKTWNTFEAFTDKLMEAGQQIVDKKMSALEAGEDPKSAFLSHLFLKGGMTSKEITGLVVDLLSAAVETTSTASTWCLYLIAQNPRVQERLYQEICEATPEGGAISSEQLMQLPYIKAVVKETLRMYPIVYSTSRHLDTDVEVGGYNIPAGTHVQANLYGMYRNPDYFPQPEEFRPERWLRENSHLMDSTIKATSNLVWGHGARMCLGRRIAEQEMHITICKIVQNFELSYHHDEVKPTLNTMMTPDRPVNIRFTPRV